MKKSKLFILLIAVILLATTQVFAADYGTTGTEPILKISIEGETTAKPEETKTATVKVSSDSVLVGVVSGKLVKNDNITSITVTGKNNWNLTYNDSTGVFNIYKAQGTTAEEIINIEYTVGNTEGTGKITISDVKFTTIEGNNSYKEVDVASVSKEISIQNDRQDGGNPTTEALSNIKITKAPTKTEYKVGDKFDKTGMVVTAEYSDGTTREVTDYTYSPDGKLAQLNTKITVTYTEGEVTKTAEQSIKVASSVASEEKTDGDLPKTGISNYYMVIAIITIIGAVSYISYRKYKNI